MIMHYVRRASGTEVYLQVVEVTRNGSNVKHRVSPGKMVYDLDISSVNGSIEVFSDYGVLMTEWSA